MSSDRDNHRSRLLQAAHRLLREREYANITARDLVAASDTNLGSIGYHFGSKEALLNEAIGLALEEWTDAIGATIEGYSGDGVMALMTGSLGMVLDRFDSIRPYYQAFLEALARSARSPELRAQLAAHYNRQRERIAAWILAALGEQLAVAEARHIASLMLATADGMLIQDFIDSSEVPSRKELASSMGKALAGAGGGLA
jgi:AcrR family transcriptional regulator